jgi:hypothetical protein
MAIYFCVMYLVGGSMGTSVTGWLSDRFAKQAVLDGVSQAQASAVGLRRALFELPLLAVVLAVVLLAAARLLAARSAARPAAPEAHTELA